MRLLPALLSTLALAGPLAADGLRISTRPDPPWIEPSGGGQLLNFDLLVENASGVALELAELEIVVRDSAGALVFRRALDGNGVRPSIQSIPVRSAAPGETLLVFNPFHTIPDGFPLATVELVARFEAPDKSVREVRIEVHPRRREGAALRLPLGGPVLHHDGHDYLAHHRRFDYLFAPIHAMGFDSNVMRYAYDFVPLDAEGRMSRGDESKNESWFGFGAPVSAAANGEVVAARGDRPDDREFDESKIAEDMTVLFGNYVVIRHAEGVFSLSAHLKQGSVVVKAGDRVRAGQAIAAVGASGGVSLPHLHFQLQACADSRCEGLPAEFEGFRRVRGKEKIAVARGPVDTGEIVERD